jgi:hypothetical protein
MRRWYIGVWKDGELVHKEELPEPKVPWWRLVTCGCTLEHKYLRVAIRRGYAKAIIGYTDDE